MESIDLLSMEFYRFKGKKEIIAENSNTSVAPRGGMEFGLVDGESVKTSTS